MTSNGYSFRMLTSRLYVGNVLERLAEIEEGSVRTCVTSPPYYGLRDYGTADYEGGDPDCKHTISHNDAEKSARVDERVTRGNRTNCLKCGARRIDNQIGLESSPEEYVANIVAVFREVWRVLTDDGTVWLNLGDSYWGGKGQSGSASAEMQAVRNERGDSLNRSHQSIGGKKYTRPTDGKHSVIKPKDLVGIPWRVALALQADGWYLRQDIIWSKPNPMPESVKDRCTKSHEYIFLLSKSKCYYFDSEAIKEPVSQAYRERAKRATSDRHKNSQGAPGQSPHTFLQAQDRDPDREVPETRNRRSVWTVTTKPFKGAHFATYPEELIEPCILAGSAPDDTVLDPFTGSGTTAVVANRLGRNFVGTELNPDYATIASKRIGEANPLFASIELL